MPLVSLSMKGMMVERMFITRVGIRARLLKMILRFYGNFAN